MAPGIPQRLLEMLLKLTLMHYWWTSQSEGNCPCNKRARGCPPRSVEEKVVTKENESDTER